MLTKNQKMITVLIAIALFMETFDLSAINNALPYMAKTLKVEPINLKMALTCYLFLESLFIPISGWLSHKLPLKKILIYSLMIFTIASFFCGIATTPHEMVVFRSLQGIGAAFCTSIGRLTLVKIFDQKKLLAAINSVMSISLIGTFMGPPLGGIITYFFSWRYIFFINIPIFLIEFLLIKKFLCFEEEQNIDNVKFDVIGYALISLFLTSFYIFFDLALFYSVNILISCLILILGISFLLTYIHWCKKKKNPVMPLSLFKKNSFRVGMVSNFTFRLIFGSVPFISMLILQTRLNISPIASGLLLANIAAGMILMKRVMHLITGRFDTKSILIFNSGAIGILVLFICLSFYFHNFITLLFSLFFYGFFASLHYSILNIISYTEVPKELSSNANTVINTIRILGINFGIAFSVLIVKLLLSFDIKFTNAYILCLACIAVIAFLNIPSFRRLQNLQT